MLNIFKKKDSKAIDNIIKKYSIRFEVKQEALSQFKKFRSVLTIVQKNISFFTKNNVLKKTKWEHSEDDVLNRLREEKYDHVWVSGFFMENTEQQLKLLAHYIYDPESFKKTKEKLISAIKNIIDLFRAIERYKQLLETYNKDTYIIEKFSSFLEKLKKINEEQKEAIEKNDFELLNQKISEEQSISKELIDKIINEKELENSRKKIILEYSKKNVAALLLIFALFSAGVEAAQLEINKCVKQEIRLHQSREQMINELNKLWKEIGGKNLSVTEDDIIEQEINKWDRWILDFVDKVGFVKKKIYSGGAFDPISKRIIVPYINISKENIMLVLSEMNMQETKKLIEEDKGNMIDKLTEKYNQKIEQLWIISGEKETLNSSVLSNDDLIKLISYLKSTKENLNKNKAIYVDALDHEFVHAFIDSNFGLLKSPYLNQKKSDLKNYVIKLLESSKLKEQILRMIEVYHSELFRDLNLKKDGIKDFLLKSDFVEGENKYENHMDLFLKFLNHVEDEPTDMPSFGYEASEKSFDKIKLKFEKRTYDILRKEDERKFFKSINKKYIKDIFQELVLLEKDRKGNETYYLKKFPYINLYVKKEINSDNHKEFYFVIKWIYDTNSIKFHKYANQNNLSISIEETNQFMKFNMEYLVYHSIITEIHARLIDGLMSLYLGKNTMNQWRLDESNLEYLSQYTYKGEQVFKKGIEKYRVALQMEKDCMSHEKIKSELMFTEEYIYKGIKYKWPSNGFIFKTKIPFEKSRF